MIVIRIQSVSCKHPGACVIDWVTSFVMDIVLKYIAFRLSKIVIMYFEAGMKSSVIYFNPRCVCWRLDPERVGWTRTIS